MNWSGRHLLQELRELFGDHYEIADLIARVREAIERADKPLAHALLQTLQALEEVHYRGEEGLMQRVGYDGLARHREEHLHLIEDLRHINQTLALEGIGTISAMISGHLEQTVAHTREADAQFSAFVERGAARD